MRISELKYFALAMKDMNYLVDLSLQGNLMDEEMIKWLVAGLNSNQTILYLNLSNISSMMKGKNFI